MEQILGELTVWHWLALGLVLFGIEMLTGTFDLLMMSIAAWLTGGFAWMGPPAYAGWQGQLVFFGIAALVLIVIGRTLLSGMRNRGEEHPTLNKRMVSLVGQRGQATVDFSGGMGQIQIGDSVWRAEAADRMVPIHAGDSVVVEGAQMTTAVVRKV